jgi:hypothetical protein
MISNMLLHHASMLLTATILMIFASFLISDARMDYVSVVVTNTAESKRQGQ